VLTNVPGDQSGDQVRGVPMRALGDVRVHVQRDCGRGVAESFLPRPSGGCPPSAQSTPRSGGVHGTVIRGPNTLRADHPGRSSPFPISWGVPPHGIVEPGTDGRPATTSASGPFLPYSGGTPSSATAPTSARFQCGFRNDETTAWRRGGALPIDDLRVPTAGE